MINRNLITELRRTIGAQYVLIEKEDVVVYEQDGSIFQVMPEIVVLLGSSKEVAEVVKAARSGSVPIVPRGSGTGLAGGAVPAPKSHRHRRAQRDQCRHHQGRRLLRLDSERSFRSRLSAHRRFCPWKKSLRAS